jgi:hypothetical protein
MRPMTRARIASSGVGDFTAFQPLLDAVLMLWVSLVQGAVTTLQMIFNRLLRDWHTKTAHEALPQATSGIQLQERTHTHGVILGLVPRISVGTPRGLAIDPLETHNRDSRHKAENDTAVVAAPGMETDLLIRVPREGGDPVLRAAQTHTHRSALTRADQTPACAGMRWRESRITRHLPPCHSERTRSVRAGTQGRQAPPVHPAPGPRSRSLS